MTEPVRLSKRVATQFSCSRREAELYIEGGWVSVDDIVIEAPQCQVSPTQTVTLHPDARPEPVLPVTLLLHKPAGIDADADTGPTPAFTLLSADTHAAGDNSGITLLHRHFTRLDAPLPLETTASGLLVLTQDGRVIRKLREDAELLEQEYVADVLGAVSDQALTSLQEPVTFNGRTLPTVKVSRQSESRLRFALKGARPGQIAWMCERAGLTLLQLKRLRIGRIPLAGLPEGQWRYLSLHERF